MDKRYALDKETIENCVLELTNEMKKDLEIPQKNHWKNTDYGKGISVEKLVAEYNLCSMQIFPYTHCKARVWFRCDNDYIATSNIGIIDRTDGYTEDYICGCGNTIEKALDDLISNIIELIIQYEKKLGRKLTDEDYCYSDPQDF